MSFAGSGPEYYTYGGWNWVLQKRLTPGSWAITATVNGLQDPAADGSWLYCELRNGDDGFIGGTSAYDNGDAHSMTMNGGLVITPDSLAVHLYCRGRVHTKWEGAQLMAMKVGGFG